MSLSTPAFPQHPEQGDVENLGGMTLLDHFAGLAMQGWLASYGEESRHPADSGRCLELARLSYEVAEAMLVVRQARLKAVSGKLCPSCAEEAARICEQRAVTDNYHAAMARQCGKDILAAAKEGK